MESAYENFKRIDEKRRKKIIDASLEEFAVRGYEKASTNNIIKKAGIAKGTLFYFFRSKKDLYYYILDHAVNIIIDRFKEQAEDFSCDLFERLLQRGMIKFRIAVENPLIFKLLFDSAVNAPDSMKYEIRDKYASFFSRNEDNIYRDIDISRFREGIDLEKAVKTVTIFLEGLLLKYMELFRRTTPDDALKLYEEINREAVEYFEILKKGLYC